MIFVFTIVCTTIVSLKSIAGTPDSPAHAASRVSPSFSAEEFVVTALVKIATTLAFVVLLLKATEWAVVEIYRSVDELTGTLRSRRSKERRKSPRNNKAA